MPVPGIRAFLFEPPHDVLQRFVIFEPLPAAVAIKNDNRDAPETLARDAPVRTFLDHFVHAVFAPRRNPFHLMDFFERFLAQRFLTAVRGLIHVDEPLLGGAENHRIVAAPAVRVGVLVVVKAEQRATILQDLHDNRIRAEYVLALVFRQAFEIAALVVQRRVNLQLIFLSRNKIIRTVAGSRMHDAAALIERDVVGKNSWHFNRKEWVLESGTLKLPTLNLFEDLGFLDSTLRLQCRNAVSGQEKLALFGFYNRILELVAECERAVMRESPWRGCP